MSGPLPKVQGFTLLELLITIAIAGVLASLAVPSFIQAIRTNRNAAMTNELVGALSFARSEAIKRGLPVAMRHLSATASVWEEGFDIFVDINGNGQFDDDGNATPCETTNQLLTEDCLLRTYDAQTFAGFTVRTGGNFANWLAYDNTGAITGSGGLGNDSFRLCPHGGDPATDGRSVRLIPTGRIRSEQGTVSCP